MADRRALYKATVLETNPGRLGQKSQKPRMLFLHIGDNLTEVQTALENATGLPTPLDLGRHSA